MEQNYTFHNDVEFIPLVAKSAKVRVDCVVAFVDNMPYNVQSWDIICNDRNINGLLSSWCHFTDTSTQDLFDEIEREIMNWVRFDMSAVKEAQQSADIIRIVTDAMERPHHD